VTDPREAQIATWTAMRRGGKLRHVAGQGLGAGVVVAVAMAGVAWIKTGSLMFTSEAVIGFVIVGLMSAARARSEWNKFASIYPDIGVDDRAGQ
jgi:hypothetical protein